MKILKPGILLITVAFLLSTINLSGQTNEGTRLGKFKQKLLERWAKKNSEVPKGVERLEFKFNNTMRSYLQYIPQTTNQKKIPMIMFFHGGGGSAAQAIKNYHLTEAADKHGFILVAPNGSGKSGQDILLTWNVFFGFGYAQEANIDDLGFVAELVKKLKSELPIDPDRIYATGISNGGALCFWLAAQPDNPFAAIAPVVGPMCGREPDETILKTPPKPGRPVPVMMIYGELDQNVPLAGGLQKKSANGKPKYLSSVQENLTFWVKANDCDPSPVKKESFTSKNATQTIYRGKDKNSEVILWLLHDQGHAWPGGDPPRAKADKPSRAFMGNEEIIEFFKGHFR